MWIKIGKIIITVILVGIAGFMLYLHNTSNLSGRYFFNETTTVTNASEVLNYIVKQYEASASMGFREMTYWIILPWIFIITSLLIWWRRNAIRWAIVPSILIFVTIYAVASFTNHVGVKRNLSRELPLWEKTIEERDFASAELWYLTNERSFTNGYKRLLSPFPPSR